VWYLIYHSAQFESSLLVYRLYINLTPFIPLSLKGEGGDEERGANAPLIHPQKIGFPNI
jgi:hypothetical protein